ncbi:helix-turn-helix domain-containing protein [Calidithermus chliarophilus]|uniref:helix-turn-helix domain-containing protein n=1 Tax=Calidithermus chliarophilus TaxID=52023 RepID=UPI000423A6BD|nr:helix-turn-helix domain-containing protein [Calidithermus chliarophilus]
MAKTKKPPHDTGDRVKPLRELFSGWDDLSPEQQERLARLLSEPEPDWGEPEDPAEARHDVVAEIVREVGVEALEAADAGALIALAKAVSGLSQRQLAERVGVSNPRVAQVQKAGQAVEVQTLERFAEAMGYTLELRFVPKDPRGGPVLVARGSKIPSEPGME